MDCINANHDRVMDALQAEAMSDKPSIDRAFKSVPLIK